MTSFLDATQSRNSNLTFSTVKTYPRSDLRKEVEIDYKPRGFWSRSRLHQVYFQAQQSTIDKAEEEFDEKQCFSQAQYQAADLCKCLPNHLSLQEKEKLYAVLDKHRFLFKGTLGLLPTKPVHVEIKSNAKPFHGHTFSVPKAYESMIRNEVTTSTSSAGATKANGPHLLSELPRKMVRFDLSQTSSN
jgi:hypothetical protein